MGSTCFSHRLRVNNLETDPWPKTWLTTLMTAILSSRNHMGCMLVSSHRQFSTLPGGSAMRTFNRVYKAPCRRSDITTMCHRCNALVKHRTFSRTDVQVVPQQRLIASEGQARASPVARPPSPRLSQWRASRLKDIQPQQREAGLHTGSSPSCNCSQTTLEPVIILSLLSPSRGGL